MQTALNLSWDTLESLILDGIVTERERERGICIQVASRVETEAESSATARMEERGWSHLARR